MIIGFAAAKLTLGVSSSTVIVGRTLGFLIALGAGAFMENDTSSKVLGGPVQILVMKAMKKQII
jgi:hypothetical protein